MVGKKKLPQARLGIYIHIPFCRSKCDYCDFYSLAGREERMGDYQKALLAHMKETAPQADAFQVDTVYFGGGTPSFYGEKYLRELLWAVKKYYRLSPGAEVTLEANPDSAGLRALAKLRRGGFNRLSLGMQSACPGELERIHRPHTAQQTSAAVAAARKAGFRNLSLDLIYGLPGQNMNSWRRTVEHALSLQPEHLSCYGLKVEEGTPLARRVLEGEVLPDDDAQADLYLWTVRRLEEAGFEQYEISNFARPGFASRHNLKYWLLEPYIGFGPGAHSDFGGRRYCFVRDLEGYIQGVLRGGRIVDSDEFILTRERGGEYLMLRLRTAQGVEEREYRSACRLDFSPIEARLREFARRGWAAEEKGRWRLTAEGFLLSNRLIGELLERRDRGGPSGPFSRAETRSSREENF